ncbi:tripartite motif-containing protein 16-like [Sander vitreus]
MVVYLPLDITVEGNGTTDHKNSRKAESLQASSHAVPCIGVAPVWTPALLPRMQNPEEEEPPLFTGLCSSSTPSHPPKHSETCAVPSREDVACDVCTGRKLKALKSCLVCLVSYCDQHLQPHYDSSAFEKHELVEPSKNLQENICSRHDEVMKMFCRTDQQLICYLCTLDEHKGHDTVSAAAERTERQKELEVSQQNIQQRIQDREKDVKLLQREVEAINHSANKAVEDSAKSFSSLIRFMKSKSTAVKWMVRFQQKTEVSRVKELQEKLKQEITELKRKDAELKKLSDTEGINKKYKNK